MTKQKKPHTYTQKTPTPPQPHQAQRVDVVWERADRLGCDLRVDLGGKRVVNRVPVVELPQPEMEVLQPWLARLQRLL